MIPLKLVLNNFLSHSKSELDFSNFEVALVLGNYEGDVDVSNGAGKSSIFAGICYALFDKGRGKKKDDVIKKGEKQCFVEFYFDIDGINYKIIRKRDKLIGQSSVVFYQEIGGEFVNISADTNKLTDEKIINTIKFNYDVFTNSVYFKQGDIDMFINATPAKRKEVLRSVLDLDKWEDYYKRARDNHKFALEKVGELNAQIIPMHSIDDDIKEKQAELLNLQRLDEHLAKEYNERNDLLLKKESKYHANVSDIINKIAALESERDRVSKRILSLKNSIDKNIYTINQNTEELKKYEEKLKSVKEKIKLKDGIDLKTLDDKMIVGKTKANVLKNRIDSLEKNVNFGDKCELCFSEIHADHVEVIKNKRKEESLKLKEEYDSLTIKLKNANNKLQQLRSKVEIANNAIIEKGKIELFINKLQNSISVSTEDNNRNEKELNSIVVYDFDEEILGLKKLVDKEAAEQDKKEIDDLKRRLSDIRSKKDMANIQRGQINTNIEDLNKKKEDQKKLSDKISSMNHNLLVYDRLKYAFGKDGIQSVIIEGIVGELEHFTNETLAKICNEPTNIVIKMQKTNDNGNVSDTFDIEISRNGETDDLEMLSGGEKFRVSLAMRLALSKILAKKIGGVVKFLLLDEVSSSLDVKGVQTFVTIIKQLSDEFKILLISHDEKVKEHFDDVIIVNKDSSGSRIIQ